MIRKEIAFTRHSRAVAQRNSVAVTACIRLMPAQARPELSIEKRGELKIPPLAEELLVIGSCWERES